MRIWIVNSEEPLPMLTGKGRTMRGGMLAEFFSEHGQKVTWWCSTFLHYEKKFCTEQSCVKKISENLSLHLVHVEKAYQKNISPARILYCQNLATKFAEAAKKENKPDVIYCAWPHIEVAYECVKYGKKNNVPVVIDIRDFWPDIFTQPFHGVVKSAASLAVDALYKKKTEYVMQNADKVIGVVPKCMDLALKYGRKMRSDDHPLYLSFKKRHYSNPDLEAEYDFWKKQKITRENFLIIYLGAIQKRIVNFDLIIEAAGQCKDPKVKFILCGDGPSYEEYREKTRNMQNILLPGYMNQTQMAALCSMDGIGLLPYYNTPDFIDSLPSKFSEYLSYGLPIATTLKGLSKSKLEQENCGMYFESSDELNVLIDKYVSCENFYRYQSSNACQLFEREFNADNTYAELLEELKNLCGH